MGNHGETLKIEYDDISMKTKHILTQFGLTFAMLRFDEKSFFIVSLGFIPYWVFEPINAIHADSPVVYTYILNLGTRDKIPLKRDVIDGSVVNGIREPILFSFILDKPARYKTFCEPETILYDKINKLVLNTITFYLEDNEGKEVNVIQETLNFTLELIKTLTSEWAFEKLKLILIALAEDIVLLHQNFTVI